MNWQKRRLQILHRDNRICAYCGDPFAHHVDHIVALSRGGDNSPYNLVTACARCNLSKGAKTIGYEWLPKRISGWLYEQLFTEPERDVLPGEDAS